MQEENRIVNLEFKLAHAERTIEELSEEQYRQQRQIEKLEQSIINLTKKIESNTNGELEIGPANEKPPHY